MRACLGVSVLPHESQGTPRQCCQPGGLPGAGSGSPGARRAPVRACTGWACAVCVPPGYHATVLGGQILDPTFHAMAEPALLALGDLLTPGGGESNMGHWHYSPY